MNDEAIRLERFVKAKEFAERWDSLGFKNRPQIAAEVGVSDDAVKTWETATRPIPRYAWRALERCEEAEKKKRPRSV